jgi:hypothetical protein
VFVVGVTDCVGRVAVAPVTGCSWRTLRLASTGSDAVTVARFCSVRSYCSKKSSISFSPLLS